MNYKSNIKKIIVIYVLFFLLNPIFLFAEEADQFAPYVDGTPEGCKLIQGDIIVPESWTEAAYASNLWPGGIVPYEFDSNVTTTNQNLMLDAMAEWEAVANVDFVPRNGEDDYIHIQNSTRNSSFVGMIGGEQVINIFNWNWRFIMAHELCHALGFWHEQSRPDRDDYVQINWDNMGTSTDTTRNFQIQSTADVYPKQEYGLVDTMTYDFDSVMHYGQFAFSNNGLETITVLAPNTAWQTRIGQRNHLSFIDQLTMSFLYRENTWHFIDGTYSGPSIGSFIFPYSDFNNGMNSIPSGSNVIIQPGSYNSSGTYNRPMTLTAPLGNVVIGQ